MKMAMAVRGKNAHYKMAEILRRHWNHTAKSSAVGSDLEPTIARFIERAPQAIAQVRAQLPAHFPTTVSDCIFNGILRQIAVLRGQA